MSFLLADCKKLDFGGLLAVNGGAGCSGGTSISEGTTISIENSGYNPGNIEGISLPPSGTSGPKSWNPACDGGRRLPPDGPYIMCSGCVYWGSDDYYGNNHVDFGAGKQNTENAEMKHAFSGNSQIFVSEKRYY